MMLQTDTTRRRSVDPIGIGFVSQLNVMARILRDARERSVLMGLSAAFFLVIGVTAYGQIELNAWNRPFYNALSHKDLRGFCSNLSSSRSSPELCSF